MRFVGIDFGWQRQASGLALLHWNGNSLHLAKLDLLEDRGQIVAWVDERAGRDAVIGVDAPTVMAHGDGLRDADRSAHLRFGRQHAGAYPASRSRSYWERAMGLGLALEQHGFAHGDSMPPRAQGRWQIEVYPNAALVQLFALDQILKYKRGPLVQRSAELGRLREMLLEHLPFFSPRLAMEDLPAIPATGRDLKNVEDQLAALLSAYVAAYWWYWGRSRNDVLGDASRGYIIVPHRRGGRTKLSDLRESYMQAGLLEEEMNSDPIAQFEIWFDQAQDAELQEPNAMTLATASSDGVPSARIVLLKGVSTEGFVFYTNYESRKGQELDENPRAALVFHWAHLERQVRVTGTVAKISSAESAEYFQSRPKGHRLGAWASCQSAVIPGRETLEKRLQALEEEYGTDEVPLPPYWGGYRLRPESIEFWQGRPNRLHDRIRYQANPRGGWDMERLAP